MRDPVQIHRPDAESATPRAVEPERWERSVTALGPLVAVLAEIAERIERERLAKASASDVA